MTNSHLKLQQCAGKAEIHEGRHPLVHKLMGFTQKTFKQSTQAPPQEYPQQDSNL